MTGIIFAPLLPLAATLILVALAVLTAGALLIGGGQGRWWRTLVLLTGAAAIANPTLVREQRDALADIALIMVDESASQSLDDRNAATEAAVAALRADLARYDQLDVRAVAVGDLPDAPDGRAGTLAFRALDQALADLPADRLAGTILVTDGQVHDAPAAAEGSNGDDNPLAERVLNRPFHVLLTGRKDERDRRLVVEQAPAYGIVGEPVTVDVRIDDPGGEGEPVRVSARIDGGDAESTVVQVGETASLRFVLAHGGETALEFEVEPGPEELTETNNRAVVVINGVRDRMQVMLVSGEPSQGLRTWRNLLKADPAVDLVHFTILRPPNKQDVTPVRELSLIPFPSGELFATNLREFDLIIFDRYHRRGILPMMYLGNVVDYVLRGGAVLDTAGPAFATPLSLANTPLGSVLPGVPTGDVIEQGFRPALTGEGRRHPVTAGLPGAGDGENGPRWGRWFRLIGAEVDRGTTLMEGLDDRPILVLERIGEGRVAQLLSDQSWLWSRGFEGGGPQADLLRRLVHWLMKEPDLEENSLTAEVDGQRVTIRRQSLQPVTEPVTVIGPDGAVQTVTLDDRGDGRASAVLEVGESGLYRLTHDELGAIAVVGAANPIEMSDVRATEAVLKPVAGASGGAVLWLAEDPTPNIRLVRPDQDKTGRDWIGLVENRRYMVTGLEQLPLLPPLLLLLLLVGGLMAAWRAEGR